MRAGIEVLSKIPSEKRQEFIQSFKVLPQYEGYKENCIFFKLFEDVGELNHFMWIEHWINEGALEKYLQSDRFKTILGAVETMGELIRLNRTEFEDMPIA
jgi:quinol monooxygenase YgiN